MSVLAPTVSPVSVNPWHWLREMAHVTLCWHDGEPMGLSDLDAATISLQRGMSHAERRSTIAHEVIHHERGYAIHTALLDREELQVEKEAARRLLPDVRMIGEALAWSNCTLPEAAYELAVDDRTLWVRLRYLHPSERGYLRERLADL